MVNKNRLFFQKVENAAIPSLTVRYVLKQFAEYHTWVGFCRFVPRRASTAEPIKRFSHLRPRNNLVVNLPMQFL